ncbi:MAG: hypothetical protein R1F52_03315 [Candidatus Nitrosoabyssus spongiisocia]|nr:MAG: hypothetical protein R1F52_03315 [Nitrosopumilaceae archaeon AB1(1)]
MTLQDISVDKVMKMAKLIANTDRDLSKEDIFMGFGSKQTKKMLERSLKTCLDLKIIVKSNNCFKIRPDMVDEIRNCHVSDLLVLFRKFLQDFPPFLLYVNLLTQGLTKSESVGFIKTLMKIDNSEKQIMLILNKWGNSSGALKKDKTGDYITLKPTNILPRQYLDKLVESLNNEIGVKNFLIDILDGRTFTFLSEQGLDLNNITKALLEHEKNPRDSMFEGLSFFEFFLRKITKDLSIDVTKLDGIGGIVKKLENDKFISHSLANIGHGVGGARIISNHGVDKETSEIWKQTPIGSLSSVLFTIITIKSYYLYIKHKELSF